MNNMKNKLTSFTKSSQFLNLLLFSSFLLYVDLGQSLGTKILTITTLMCISISATYCIMKYFKHDTVYSNVKQTDGSSIKVINHNGETHKIIWPLWCDSFVQVTSSYFKLLHVAMDTLYQVTWSYFKLRCIHILYTIHTIYTHIHYTLYIYTYTLLCCLTCTNEKAYHYHISLL